MTIQLVSYLVTFTGHEVNKFCTATQYQFSSLNKKYSTSISVQSYIFHYTQIDKMNQIQVQYN